MPDHALDPLIHVEARLRIVVTLATLPDGDALSFTRLQDMIGLTPGNLITHLRKLEDAGYLSSEKTGNGLPRALPWRSPTAVAQHSCAGVHRKAARHVNIVMLETREGGEWPSL